MRIRNTRSPAPRGKYRLLFRFLRRPFGRSRGNYERNLALEGGEYGLIQNQNFCPDYRVGAGKMARVGCEAAAVYNALTLQGERLPFSRVIRVFEETRGLMGILRAGRLGGDPYAVGRVLRALGMEYRVCAAPEELREDGVYVLSFLNGKSVFSGVHTVALRADGDGAEVWNLTRAAKGPIRTRIEALPVERFLIAYALRRAGESGKEDRSE